MCQPRKWLWGLLPLLLLGILAGYWQQRDIENDLADRGRSAVVAAGHGWGRVSVAGRDALLLGEAPSAEAKAQAVKTLLSVEGIRRVADQTTVLAEAKPFTLTALRDGAKVTLSGFVPDAAAREALEQAARKAMPQVNLVNETRFARGAPPDFAALSTFGLNQIARLSEGTVQLSDGVLSVSGRAADFDQYAAVRGALAAMPGGAKLAKGLGAGDILPPRVSPFTFEARREGSAVALSGYVPSPEARLKLLADLKAAGLSVRDSLKVADGAPSGDWAGALGLGLSALAKLESGTLSLVDDKLSLTGKAPVGAAAASYAEMLKGLPKGVSLARLAVEEAPRALPFSFEALNGDGLVKLRGVVADEKAKADVLALVGRLFEGDRIEHDLSFGAVPKDGMAAMSGGLHLLSRLGNGARLALDASSISLSGLALFDAARDAILQDFKRLVPASFAGNVEIGVAPPAAPVPPPECQSLFGQVLAKGSVRFRTASAALNEESRGLLDKLTAVALRCGAVKIEIGGHTDADGSPDDNAALSRRRAETVAIYFTQAGLAAERLEPVGYGETRPVAPNDSPENKAKNRRIEFVVK